MAWRDNLQAIFFSGDGIVKKLWFLAFALATAVYGQNAALPVQFCQQGGTQAAISGLLSTNYQQGIIPSCTVTVYLTGTPTLATIYSNNSGTPLSNPFTASSTGQFLVFAAVNTGYDVVLSGGISPNTYPSPVTITGVYASQDFSGASSVSNSDGSLTISPTTGAVVASLNTANANTWTAQQTFLDGASFVVPSPDNPSSLMTNNQVFLTNGAAVSPSTITLAYSGLASNSGSTGECWNTLGGQTLCGTTGSSVTVNGGSALPLANFNGGAPAADSGYQLGTFKVSSSNVSVETPQGPQAFNAVTGFGAVGDQRSVSDAVVSGTSLTSATADFTTADNTREFLVAMGLQGVINGTYTSGITVTDGAVFTGSIAPTSPAPAILTVTAITSGTIEEGQTISGTGVTSGTQVGVQISGTTGGVGTYYATTSQTTSSTTITATSVAGQFCTLTSFNGGGTGASANVYLSAAATVSASAVLYFAPNYGTGYTSNPTSATAGSGTVSSGAADCTGTVTVATSRVTYPVLTTATYVNSTTVTLGTAATTNGSSVRVSIGTDNTTALQNWLNACQSTTRVACYLPTGNYMITAPLTIANQAVTIKGDGANSAIVDGLSPDRYPYFVGSNIVQAAAGDDIFDITYAANEYSSVSVPMSMNVEGTSLQFSPPIAFWDTGNGWSVAGGSLTAGVIESQVNSSWKNLAVYGTDGSHCAFWFPQAVFNDMSNVAMNGGGGLCLPNTEQSSNNVGNSSYNNIQASLFAGGSYSAFYLNSTGSGGSAVNLITFTEPHAGRTLPPGTYAAQTPALNPYLQEDFYAGNKVSYVTVVGADFESESYSSQPWVTAPLTSVTFVNPFGPINTTTQTAIPNPGIWFYSGYGACYAVSGVQPTAQVPILGPANNQVTFPAIAASSGNNGGEVSCYGGSGDVYFMNFPSTSTGQPQTVTIPGSHYVQIDTGRVGWSTLDNAPFLYGNSGGYISPGTFTTNAYKGPVTFNTSNFLFPEYIVDSGCSTFASGTATVSTTNACALSSTCMYLAAYQSANGSSAMGNIILPGTVVSGTSVVFNSVLSSAPGTPVSTDNSNFCWWLTK